MPATRMTDEKNDNSSHSINTREQQYLGGNVFATITDPETKQPPWNEREKESKQRKGHPNEIFCHQVKVAK